MPLSTRSTGYPPTLQVIVPSPRVVGPGGREGGEERGGREVEGREKGKRGGFGRRR